MLKSCSYCGKIHDSKIVCKNKRKNTTEIDRFRWSKTWKKKAKQILERDTYLCQMCLRKEEGTIRQHNAKELSVHHITPIAEDYEKRLDDDNLITLCSMHHSMAERGKIKKETLQQIAAKS